MQTKGKNEFFQTLRLVILGLMLFSGIAGFLISYLMGLYQHGTFLDKHLLLTPLLMLLFWGISYGSSKLNRYINALEKIKETDDASIS